MLARSERQLIRVYGSSNARSAIISSRHVGRQSIGPNLVEFC